MVCIGKYAQLYVGRFLCCTAVLPFFHTARFAPFLFIFAFLFGPILFLVYSLILSYFVVYKSLSLILLFSSLHLLTFSHIPSLPLPISYQCMNCFVSKTYAFLCMGANNIKLNYLALLPFPFSYAFKFTGHTSNSMD